MTLVIGLNGSPRRNGNSATLLDQALDAARDSGAEVIRYDLASLNISPCQACEDCFINGSCVIRDDMDALYDSLEEADAVIVASPIYFSGMSSQTKIVVDRCQALWARRKVLQDGRKPGVGAIILTGAQPNARFDNAVSELRAFLIGIGIAPGPVLKVAGADGAAYSAEHPEVRASARALGTELVSSISGP
ncbi:MAG TPA: flavodoxin family protein [Methanomassiliicoccales archaeon]|nr:flavodoxin family protein [Methanomassiliicoccales archaeon]HPR98609.1 flavodoxin family protein [Methanomassiliicoccales archaeon]